MWEQAIQKQKADAQKNNVKKEFKPVGLNVWEMKKNEENIENKGKVPALITQPLSATLPEKSNIIVPTIVHSESNQGSVQANVISVKDRMKLFEQQKIMGNKPIEVKRIVKEP